MNKLYHSIVTVHVYGDKPLPEDVGLSFIASELDDRFEWAGDWTIKNDTITDPEKIDEASVEFPDMGWDDES